MPSYEKRSETQSAFSFSEEDYLTPEQRLNIVADILSDIALSILNESLHENEHHS